MNYGSKMGHDNDWQSNLRGHICENILVIIVREKSTYSKVREKSSELVESVEPSIYFW